MTQSLSPAAVLFDLDGTLLDSFPAHFSAYAAMFKHFGIQVSEERFFASYSPNWYHAYEQLGLPRDQWKQADAVWLEEARKHEPALFPGVAETLAALQANHRLGLVTSGSKTRVSHDLDRTGTARFFDVIVTGDDVRQPKPSAEGLMKAIETLGVAPGSAVYIGDAQADFEMAQAAGVAFIGVFSRFANLGENTQCRMITSITELGNLI